MLDPENQEVITAARTILDYLNDVPGVSYRDALAAQRTVTRHVRDRSRDARARLDNMGAVRRFRGAMARLDSLGEP